MQLIQYYLGCLAHASYMIVDDRTKTAAVVDPQRDVDQYLQDAEENGWTIKYVFLTHFHADFVAGHIELRNRTGAEIYLGAKAEAEYEFMALKDGDIVEYGDVRLQVMETPGHTPEGISLLVFDLEKSDAEPHAVLTGDTLFIGDVGRPDLLASIGVSADELANMLYDSIERLKKLPDDTLLYPAHGAGSLCGKQLSEARVSTIGEQKRFNYALQPMSREDFISLVEVDQPDAPDYFVYDAIKNRQERASLDEAMQQSRKAFSLDEVLDLQAQGAQILDVRDAADFEGAHLKGSLNIGLQGQYAIWCGTMLKSDQPIVIIAETGDEHEAIIRLGRIGFDNVAGYLYGGMQILQDRPDLIGQTSRITAEALFEQLAADPKPVVVDIRSAKERESGFIQESLHIPLNQLEERINEIPVHAEVVVHCAGGYRSSIGCSLLNKAGRSATDLVGGFKAWQASKLPVVGPVPA